MKKRNLLCIGEMVQGIGGQNGVIAVLPQRDGQPLGKIPLNQDGLRHFLLGQLDHGGGKVLPEDPAPLFVQPGSQNTCAKPDIQNIPSRSAQYPAENLIHNVLIPGKGVAVVLVGTADAAVVFLRPKIETLIVQHEKTPCIFAGILPYPGGPVKALIKSNIPPETIPIQKHGGPQGQPCKRQGISSTPGTKGTGAAGVPAARRRLTGRPGFRTAWT